jgi:diaminopimelate decarboxylase
MSNDGRSGKIPSVTSARSAFVFDAAAGLSCDGVPLADIAAIIGTPSYVYSAASIRSAWRRFDAAFAGVPHTIHYALKANSTLALLRLLRGLGSGADANSWGEIEVALRAGFIPEQLVFTGVGKTPDELRAAVPLGLRSINAESPGEVARIDGLAQSLGTRARVAVRLNPDIEAGAHPHISTGRRINKFGVPIELGRDLYRKMSGMSGLQPVGLHAHIGSQIAGVAPLRQAAEALAAFAADLREDGIALEHIDLGGGLGISYDGAATATIEDYAAAVLPAVAPTGLTVLIEPGRAIVGSSGVLLARVVDVKAYADAKPFVVLDAGMTELIRPALYGAYHRIEPVKPRAGARRICDVVGPLCESSDVVGSDRDLAPVEVGDLVAVFDAGAYGSTMASNYNRRPLPCEALIDDGAWTVIRRRQTVDEMVANEN